MRFWDSSAVVPLLVTQPASPRADGSVVGVPGQFGQIGPGGFLEIS